MVDIYFKQRLGPQFKDASAVLISRETLLKLTRGAKALLGEMISANPMPGRICGCRQRLPR
jgi:hypothetical protein